MTNQAEGIPLQDFTEYVFQNQLFTIKQTAKILTVSEETVRLWFHTGKLSGRRIGHGIRINAESIKAVLSGGAK